MASYNLNSAERNDETPAEHVPMRIQNNQAYVTAVCRSNYPIGQLTRRLTGKLTNAIIQTLSIILGAE
jgi:hypothetical protein